jgi:multiple sugar transport system substrate-binding protein
MEPGALDSLIEQFERNNPGVTILLDTRPYNEIWDLYVSGAEPGAGDILGIDPRWFYELIDNNTLESLGSFKKSSGSSAGLSVPEEGEEWALPLVSFMDILYYNIDILKEAGFNRPPKTQAEVLELAEKISAAQGNRFALSLALSPDNPRNLAGNIFPWIWASGTALFSGDTPRFSNASIKETLGFLNQLYQQGRLLPGVFTQTEADKIKAFQSGRIALMTASISAAAALSNGGIDFDITVIPGPAAYIGKPVFGLESWYAGISAESAHKDEAWAFLSFLQGEAAYIAAQAHAGPGISALKGGYIEEDPRYAKAYDIYAAGDALQEFTGVPRAAEHDRIALEEIRAMFEGTQTPEAAAEAIQRRWEGIRARP